MLRPAGKEMETLAKEMETRSFAQAEVGNYLSRL